jgi:hypothetical protein
LFLLAVRRMMNREEEEPTEEDKPYTLDYGIFPTPDIPADNPLTVEGVKLGRMLFYDNLLVGQQHNVVRQLPQATKCVF